MVAGSLLSFYGAALMRVRNWNDPATLFFLGGAVLVTGAVWILQRLNKPLQDTKRGNRVS